MTLRTPSLLASLGLTGLGIERGIERIPSHPAAAPRGSVDRWRTERAAAHRTILIVGVTAIRGDDGFGDTALRAPVADPRTSWLRQRP